MSRMIHCAKLKKLAEALEKPPFPGPLGERIFTEISAEAWQLWIAHQTMLINEFRLSMLDPKARVFLSQEMDNFLFGQGSAAPPGYAPPTK